MAKFFPDDWGSLQTILDLDKEFIFIVSYTTVANLYFLNSKLYLSLGITDSNKVFCC